jgi:hypothetical protein
MCLYSTQVYIIIVHSPFGKFNVIILCVCGPNDRYPRTPKTMYKRVTIVRANLNKLLNIERTSFRTDCSSERTIPAPS